MKKFIIILSVLSLYSCKKEQKTKVDIVQHKSVTINVKVKNYNLQDSITSVSAYYYDNILNQKSYDFDIDKEGNFVATLDINHQQDINIYYKNWITLLVEPGDSISISFDGDHKTTIDLYSNIEISGDAVSINKDFFTFLKEDTALDNYLERIQKLEPDTYIPYHDSIFNVRKQYINHFIASQPDIDQALKDWLFVEKELVPANYLIVFPMNYRMFNPQKAKSAKYDENFYNSLSQISELGNEHLINSKVSTFGNHYLFHYSQKIRPFGVKMEQRVVDSLTLRRIIEDNKDNLFLAQLAINDKIKSSLEAKKVDFINREKQLLNELYQNSSLKDPIFDKYEMVKVQLAYVELPKDAELLTFKSENVNDYLSEVIANAKGKVIYIDHWATWCAPCRSQFKNHTPKFKKKYGDKIEFVYFCYKSEKEQWKPLIAEYNLTGKHYFIKDEDTNALIEQIKLKGYPTYTIIDQKGNIVKSGFEFRPSEKETSEIIDELIKK